MVNMAACMGVAPTFSLYWFWGRYGAVPDRQLGKKLGKDAVQIIIAAAIRQVQTALEISVKVRKNSQPAVQQAGNT